MNKNLSFPWGEIGGKKPILHLYKTQKKKKNPIDRRNQATVANFINHPLPLASCRASSHPPSPKIES